MSTYDIFASIRDLADECDKIVDQGKTAILAEDIEKIISLTVDVKALIPRLRDVLLNTKELIVMSNKEDKLVKYVDVYYRMMILVNLPYISMMLRDSASILSRRGRDQEASDALSLADAIDSLLDTLKR